MADTNFRGPVNSMGSLEAQAGNTATIEPLDGPSIFYQGSLLPNPRSFPFAKDGTAPARVSGWLANSDILIVDNIPQAATSSVLAAAQAGTALTAMALATVGVTNFSSGAASVAVGVPIIPFGSSTPINVIALDFGFTTGTTTANSSSVQVADNTLFTQGQWLVLGNVGNSASTLSLITQVQSISTTNTTTITVSPSPVATLGVPIGAANLFGSGLLPAGTQFGPTNASANAHSVAIAGGLARVINPRELLARNVSFSIATGASLTTAVTVVGYDIYGQQMSEIITANASTGVSIGYGKKAFKYLQSATISTSTGGTSVLLGLGDTFGFGLRCDEAEYAFIQAGGTTVSNTVGITKAISATATNTTGDVRGTVQISGLGAGTPISAVATSNNVNRLVVIQTLNVWNTIYATPLNTAPMLGVTQA